MTDQLKFPLPSPEREETEEALGLLWRHIELGATDAAVITAALERAGLPAVLERLVRDGWALEAGGRVSLTPGGQRLAADVTRRHRLAERLLTDVLSLDARTMDPTACVLEHILSPEVVDSICTLLGHPAECPHGLAIPPGLCCGRKDDRLGPVVIPLSELRAGERGRVAWLRLKNHPELHRLMALGLIPGACVHVHQTAPAFVVDVDESQLALEERLAERILVRRFVEHPSQ